VLVNVPKPFNIQEGCVPKPLVVLLGPTAVGKSRVAIPVAKAMGTEILTADSRQVYRGMDIGMDKPSPAERDDVPHRLIDLTEPDRPFSVGEYRRLAVQEIERLHREGRVPLVAGGTGLYIRALVRGLWEGPGADWEYRRRLIDEASEKGKDVLHRHLAEVDPELAKRLHPRDQAKVIRALEIHHLLGRSLSDVHRHHGFHEQPYAALLIGLIRPRTSLYRAIDARVDEQLRKGLLEETRRLLKQGYGRDLGSMKGLGYRQMGSYVASECSFEEAVRRLKRDTRRFAKRQMTWFRKEPGIVWLSVEDQEPAEQTAKRVLVLIERFLLDLPKFARSAGILPAAPVSLRTS
jgi:tRNA dimethylallyltransferase